MTGWLFQAPPRINTHLVISLLQILLSWADHAEPEGDVAVVRVGLGAEGRAAVLGEVVPRATAQGCSFNGFLVYIADHAEPDVAADAAGVVEDAVGRAAAPGAVEPGATAQ